MKAEIAIAANILQANSVEMTAEKYGWRAEKNINGYSLYTAKGNHMADLTIKGKKYLFTDALNNKLMSGNDNPAKAVEKLLTGYYYAKPINTLSDEDKVRRLLFSK